jgi:peptidoglycan/LPS O-acetylase OafA/YrhL
VEVQFYLTIALLYALFRHRGLYLLPVLCVIVTGIRIATHTEISIVTYARVDEILAGATLALALESPRFAAVKSSLERGWLILLFIPLAVASANPLSGPLGYLRPYIVTLMVGQTILFAPGLTGRVLRSRTLFFLAEISYALYVLHRLVDVGWLDTGTKIVRYAKRVPALAVVFAGAWASNALLRTLVDRPGQTPEPAPGPKASIRGCRKIAPRRPGLKGYVPDSEL